MLTREEAIQRLIEHDVAKWGEGEREASRLMHERRTHGLALNALAYIDLDNINLPMAKDAQSVMTLQDHRALRDGG